MDNPYWLIKTYDKPHGIGTVSFEDAQSSAGAVLVFRERQDEYTKLMLAGLSLKAVLVTLHYDDNNQPVVTEVN